MHVDRDHLCGSWHSGRRSPPASCCQTPPTPWAAPTGPKRTPRCTPPGHPHLVHASFAPTVPSSMSNPNAMALSTSPAKQSGLCPSGWETDLGPHAPAEGSQINPPRRQAAPCPFVGEGGGPLAQLSSETAFSRNALSPHSDPFTSLAWLRAPRVTEASHAISFSYLLYSEVSVSLPP